jgi:hypothetical protein
VEGTTRAVTENYPSSQTDFKPRPRSATTSVLLVLVLGICVGIVPLSFAADSGVPANAYQGRQRRPTLDEQVQALSEKLNLSSEQRVKVKKIFEHRQMLLQRIRQNPSLSAVDRFHSMQAVSDDSNLQIKSILNAEQARKFDELTHQVPTDTSSRRDKSDTH